MDSMPWGPIIVLIVVGTLAISPIFLCRLMKSDAGLE
jgi:hypothetical protein